MSDRNPVPTRAKRYGVIIRVTTVSIGADRLHQSKWMVVYACRRSYWLVWTVFIFVSQYVYFNCNEFLS